MIIREIGILTSLCLELNCPNLYSDIPNHIKYKCRLLKCTNPHDIHNICPIPDNCPYKAFQIILSELDVDVLINHCKCKKFNFDFYKGI